MKLTNCMSNEKACPTELFKDIKNKKERIQDDDFRLQFQHYEAEYIHRYPEQRFTDQSLKCQTHDLAKQYLLVKRYLSQALRWLISILGALHHLAQSTLHRIKVYLRWPALQIYQRQEILNQPNSLKKISNSLENSSIISTAQAL